MALIQHNLYDYGWKHIFEQVKNHFPHAHYDYKKHLILIENTRRETLGYIRLPLHLSLDEGFNVLNENMIVLYLAIESGNAALHIWEGQENIYHTTFSAYMNRKKQGFSQVKYLNKKGKSRAGSRLRLKGTEVFFDQINESLNDLFKEYSIERIAVSCRATLWPYLFRANITCPFDKKDERLYKIPLHLPQSNHFNLTATVRKLKAPVLFYEEKFQDEVLVLLDQKH